MKHLVMLVNPAAGKGRGLKHAKAVLEVFEQAGVAVTLMASNSSAELSAQAREAAATKTNAIVVVGGDGTLQAVLNEIHDTDTPIALVPAGTGNDFARAHAIPYGSEREARTAAKLILEGKHRKMDLVRAKTAERDVIYHTVAALGFDALVSERTNSLRWPKGSARYYLAIFIELLRLKPYAFNIRINGGEARQMPGILAAVANSATYGGGMPICPDADAGDGLLDFTHVAPIGRFKLIRLFPLLLQGKHTSRPEVFAQRLKTVEISAPGLIVYADGERIGTKIVKIEILEAALTVIAS